MTDILTQLQSTYDQLLTQFFSTLSYLSQRHPTIAPTSDPNDPYTTTTADQIAPGPEDTGSLYPLRPNSPHTFAEAQEELADDLARKAKQINFLISCLPGQDRGEKEQEERIRELVDKVREIEVVRKQKRRDVRVLVRRLDAVVAGMNTSIDVRRDGSALGVANTNGQGYG